MVEIKTIEERKQSLLKKGKEHGYVTYEELFTFGMLIIALIGLVVEICHKRKK